MTSNNLNKSTIALQHLLQAESQAILSALVAGARYGVKIRLPHAFVMTFLFRRDLPLAQKLKLIVKLSWRHATNLAEFVALYKTALAIFKIAGRVGWMCDDGPANILRSRKVGVITWIFRNLLSLLVHGQSFGRSCSGSAESTSLAIPSPPGTPEHIHHSFLAGLFAGYSVWGRTYSSINYQIALYLASRVGVACAKLVTERLFLMNDPLPKGKEAHPGDVHDCHLQKQFVSSHHVYAICVSVIWATAVALFEARPDLLHPSMRRSMIEIYRPYHASDK